MEFPVNFEYIAPEGVVKDRLGLVTFTGAFGEMIVPEDVRQRGVRLECRFGSPNRYAYMARWCDQKMGNAYNATREQEVRISEGA